MEDSRESFEDLYRQWRAPVVRLCRGYLGPAGDPEAMAQEAFTRAWASWGRFGTGRAFGPWIVTIARRLCMNHASTRRRREELLPSAVSIRAPGCPADRALDSLAVAGALEALSSRHRRIVRLRDEQGWSYEEIARAEGVTVETVRSVLKRGRAAFRQAYERLSSVVVGGGGWLRARRGRGRWAELLTGRVVGFDSTVLAAAALLLASTPTPAVSVDTPLVVEAPRSVAAPTSGASSAVDSAGVTGEVGRRSAAAAPSTPVAGPGADGPVAVPGTGFELTPSPSYEQDRTVFAAGSADGCDNLDDACALLLRSTDGGASWTRLPAQGRPPGEIVLPPAYPRDNRIFSVSLATLSVSTDGGATFTTLAPVQGPPTISPLFSAGDARILFASDPLRMLPVGTEYHADTGLVRPLSLALPVDVAPAAFAFGPDYAVDGRVLVSTVQQHSAGKGPLLASTDLAWSIYSCDRAACERVLHAYPFTSNPTVLWSGRVAYAWTPHALYRSTDLGRSFQRIGVPVDGPMSQLWSLVTAADGRLFAIVGTPGTSNGAVYVSDDHGGTWALSGRDQHVLRATDMVALPDGRLLQAGHDPAARLRCSTDGGRTWAPRCPTH